MRGDEVSSLGMGLFDRSKVLVDEGRVLQDLGESVEAFRATLQGINDRVGALERSHREHAEASPSARVVDSVASRVAAIEATLEPLAVWRKEITLAVSEGIERVARAEGRIQSTVRSARKKLAELGLEHDGLEAAAAELHVVDGGGGEDDEVPAVPALVEDPGDEASSIPGVSRSQLMRARGL